MNPFATQTIAALTEVVTGGSPGYYPTSVGIYRSGTDLERFFGGLNIQLSVGGSSRLPAVRAALAMLNQQQHGPENIARVIEAAVDPRDYLQHPEKLGESVKYMNERLKYEGLELRKVGEMYKLRQLGTSSLATVALQKRATAHDLDSVIADFERAYQQADSDPADAVTSACSTVESVCKCILDEMAIPYPAKQDIKNLVGVVGERLNLSPGRKDLPAQWEADIKQILGGLFSVISGIGSLRTHAGDAHGKGMAHIPVDARIARLAIHAASTVSVFYIESWQRNIAARQKDL